MTEQCPTCGPHATEAHPRRPGVTRCANCKEWLACVAASHTHALLDRPCCNFIEAVEEADCGPCAGTMRAGWPEFVCDTCGARCGALAHPTHVAAPPAVPVIEHATNIDAETRRVIARLIDQHAPHGYAGVMRAPDDGCPVYVAAVALDRVLPAAAAATEGDTP